MTVTKKCTSCGHERPIDAFKPRSDRPDSLRSQCKECDNERWRKWMKTPAGRDYQTRKAERRYERNQEIIRGAKDRPCADCGVRYPYYVMEFDHVRGEKVAGLNGLRMATVRQIKAEIKKCEVVCANCHKEREHQRL